MFEIAFLAGLGEAWPEPSSPGTITIGAFTERFNAPTGYWAPSDYERQWHAGVRRIIVGHPKSCLITALKDPGSSKMLFWWQMYREGNLVHFQNALLLFDRLARPFDVSDPYASVQDRITVNDEGSPISEWQTSIDDLIAFLDGIKD